MSMRNPTLFIFAGLPGSGKSSLAKELSKATGAVYLRIDTIEQALRELCDFKVEGEGYRLSYRVAADNLKVGNDVIADSCNPIELTRNEWNQIAKEVDTSYVDIEVVCSDKSEHRRRVESRSTEIPGLVPPTWEQVEHRQYHPWQTERIVIDTANKSVLNAFEELAIELRKLGNI